jgi:hypothetical protein
LDQDSIKKFNLFLPRKVYHLPCGYNENDKYSYLTFFEIGAGWGRFRQDFFIIENEQKIL